MGKYTEIWESELAFIKEATSKRNVSKKKLSKAAFEAAGNRKNYGFRLDIMNGIVPTKRGTAVARDLKAVLDEDEDFKDLAKDKYILIQMGKSFELKVEAQ